jgi:hypothetical protein
VWVEQLRFSGQNQVKDLNEYMPLIRVYNIRGLCRREVVLAFLLQMRARTPSTCATYI